MSKPTYSGVRTITVDKDGREITPQAELEMFKSRMAELERTSSRLEDRVAQLSDLVNVLIGRQEHERLRREGFGFQTR